MAPKVDMRRIFLVSRSDNTLDKVKKLLACPNHEDRDEVLQFLGLWQRSFCFLANFELEPFSPLFASHHLHSRDLSRSVFAKALILPG